jgi:hypothetical protein
MARLLVASARCGVARIRLMMKRAAAGGGARQERPSELGGEEQGAGIAVVEGDRGAAPFIGPEDGRGGVAARSNDQR